MISHYEYYPGQAGHQYEDLDLRFSSIVDARYTTTSSFAGNPCIEALPFPRTQTEVYSAYQRDIPYRRNSKTEKISLDEALTALNALTELRFPLPFHHTLEVTFYNILTASYQRRTSKFSSKPVTTISNGHEIIENHHQLLGDPASDANTGLALLGYSGCGKSSSLEILLSHYPQVIYHYDEHGGRYPQIVYLAVNCIPNSN